MARQPPLLLCAAVVGGTIALAVAASPPPPPRIDATTSGDGSWASVAFVTPSAAQWVLFTTDGSPPAATGDGLPDTDATRLAAGADAAVTLTYSGAPFTVTAVAVDASAVPAVVSTPVSAVVALVAGTLPPPVLFPADDVFAVAGATAYDLRLPVGAPPGTSLRYAVTELGDEQAPPVWKPYTTPFTLAGLGGTTVWARAELAEWAPGVTSTDVFVVERPFPAAAATQPVCASPQLLATDGSTVSAVAASAGSYRLQVSADDGCRTYSHTAVVEVACSHSVTATVTPASATAEWRATRRAFDAVTLAASGGVGEGDARVAFQWSVVSAPPGSDATFAAFGDAARSTATFQPDLAGDYTLGVSAATGCSAGDARVWVSAPCPNAFTADAGADRSLFATGAALAFPALDLQAAPGSDDAAVEAGLTYTWSLVPPHEPNASASASASLAPLSGASSVQRRTAVLTVRQPGGYVAQLAVTDGCSVRTDFVAVAARCQRLPQLVATPDEPLAVGAASALLAARGEPNWGPVLEAVTQPLLVPGAVDAAAVMGLSVAWQLAATPRPLQPCVEDPATAADDTLGCAASALQPGPLMNPSSLAGAFFVPDVLGVYTLRLSVGDACASRHDDVFVAVTCNSAPRAHAGGDQLVFRPGRTFPVVPLNGSRTADTSDAHVRLQWRLLRRPGDSTSAHVSRNTSAVAQLHVDANGVYVVEVTATDGCSASADVATVTVQCNHGPVAATPTAAHVTQFNADGRGTGFAPVVLDGSPSYDPDGDADVLSYTWAPAPGSAPGLGASLAPLGANNPAAVLFTVPAVGIDNSDATGGGPVSTTYGFTLTVSDGCTAANTTVSVSATCPQSPHADADAGPTVVWNAVAGSRFSYPLPVGGEVSPGGAAAWRCRTSSRLADGCGAELPAVGRSTYGLPGEAVAWEWRADGLPPGVHRAADVGLAIAAPASRNTTWTLDGAAYNNAEPFNPDGLGHRVAGAIGPSLVVRDDCVRSAAVAPSHLQCNSPPVADVGPPQVFTYSPAVHFLTVTLDGSRSSPASPGPGAAAEAVRDAPTFRYEWTLRHFPLDGDRDGVEEGLAGPDSPPPPLTGDVEARRGGVHHAFVTSEAYAGDLGGVAGADAKCAAHAAAAGMPQPQQFAAVLCDGGSGGPVARLAAIDRPVYSTGAAGGGFESPDAIGRNFKVACGDECDVRLSSRAVLSPVTYDEFGRKVSATVYAGCGRDGVVRDGGTLCDGWTSASPFLHHDVGVSGALGENRFLSVSSPCDVRHRLACVRTAPAPLRDLGLHPGALQPLRPRFTPNKLGTYQVTLTVTDGCQVATAATNVTIGCNAAPAAVGGPDRVSVWENGRFSPVTLSGGAPSDPDGDDFFPSWRLRGFQPADVPRVHGVPVPGVAFADSVTGHDDAQLVNAHLMTPSLYPSRVGTFTVHMVVSDGCSRGTDPVTVSVVCNTPPAVTPATVRSVWRGAGFSPVPLVAATSDADGEPVAVTWSAAPDHAAPVPFGAPQFVDAVTGDGATSLSGANTVQPVLQPVKLGGWRVHFNASDGCTVAHGVVEVEAQCSLPPRLAVTAMVGSGGPPVEWADASAADPLRLNSPWDGAVARFRAVSLTVAGGSTFDPDGEPLTAAWTVQSVTGGGGGDDDDPPYTLTTSDDGGIAGAAAVLTPRRLGTTVLLVSVSDGCNVVSTTVTVVTGCDAPPDVVMFPATLSILWSPAQHAFPTATLQARLASGVELPAQYADSVTWATVSHVPVPPTAFEPAVAGGAGDLTAIAPVSSSDARVAQWAAPVLGTYGLQVSVDDGCSQLVATSSVVAACGDAPQLQPQGVLTSVWTGAGFSPLTMPAVVVNPDTPALVGYTAAWTIDGWTPVADVDAVTPEVAGALAHPSAAISRPDALDATVTPAFAGRHTLALRLSDGCQAGTAQYVVDAVCNAPPTVVSLDKRDADGVGRRQGGGSRWVGTGFEAVTVIATVTDADGDAVQDPTWTISAAGSAAVLPPDSAGAATNDAGVTTATAVVTPHIGGTHTVTFRAHDGCSPVEVAVTFHAGCTNAPTVDVVPDNPVAVWRTGGFAPVALSAVATNAFTYVWSVESAAPPPAWPAGVADGVAGSLPAATLETPTAATTAFHAAHLGAWSVQVLVSDGCTTAAATTTVTAQCSRRPLASVAQSDVRSVWDGRGFAAFSAATVDASPSSDPDGDLLHFVWEVVGVQSLPPPPPAATAAQSPFHPDRVGNDTGFTLSALTAPAVVLSPTKLGRWVMAVTASDGCLTAHATATVAVACNDPPVARAAASPNVTVAWQGAAFATLQLGTTAAVDTVEQPGDGLTFEWEEAFEPLPADTPGVVASRLLPPGAPVTDALSAPTTQRPLLAPTVLGTWRLTVTASDGCTSSSDSATVSVACNRPPTANAGREVHITTDGTTFGAIQLSAAANDVDGDAVSVRWLLAEHTPAPGYDAADGLTAIGGVDDAQLDQPASLAPVLQPTKLGTWRFVLQVDDGCSVVTSQTVASVSCPPAQGFPTFANPPAYVKYVSAAGGGGTITPEPPLVHLDFYDAAGDAAALWTFAEWRVVRHVCADNTVGYAPAPSVHNTDATNAGSGDDWGMCGPPREGDVAASAAYTFTTEWVGQFHLQYRAFDGCNVRTGTVVVEVACNPTPVAAAVAVPSDAPWHTDLVFREVLLDGSASADAADPPAFEPQPLRYLWRVVAAPVGSTKLGTAHIAHPSAATHPGVRDGVPVEAYAVFTPDAFGVYVVRLTVHDGCSEASADVEVEVACNPPPVADAGPGFFTSVGMTQRAASGGEDGAPAVVVLQAATPPYPGRVFYQWTVVDAPDGSAVQLSNAGTPTPSFTPDVPGVYRVQLAVADTPSPALLEPGSRTCAPALDVVAVTAGCNAPPTAVLTARASGGPTSAVWGRWDGADQAAGAGVGVDGVDYAVPSFGAVAVWSNASFDASGDAFTRAWSVVEVPPGSALAGLHVAADAVAATLSPDVPGVYRVRLALHDGCSSASAVYAVTAACGQPPVVVVDGADEAFTLFDQLHLTAQASNTFVLTAAASWPRFPGAARHNDPALRFLWTLTSAPDASGVTGVSDATSAVTSFAPDVPGQYGFNVEVHDGCAAASAAVTATVRCSQPPVVQVVPEVEALWGPPSAGGSSTPVRIAASVTDEDAVVGVDGVRWEWAVVSVPTGSRVTHTVADGSGSANTTLLADATGEYRLRLTATDGCTSSTGDVVVQVLCAEPEGNPVAIVSGGDANVITAVQGEAFSVAAAFDYAALLRPGAGAGDVPGVAFTWAFHADAATVDTGGAYVADVGTPLTLNRVRVLDATGAAVPASALAGVSAVWALSPPAGSLAVLADGTALAPTFTPDVVGDYELTVTVASGCSTATGHAVAVASCRTSPTARAGYYGTVHLTAETRDTGFPLDGSGSTGALSYAWQLVGRPSVQPWRPAAGGVADAAALQPPEATNATLADADTALPTLFPDGLGRFRLQLTVSDGCHDHVGVADVDVRCGPSPVANAGHMQRFFARPGQSPLESVGGVVWLDGTESGSGSGSGSSAALLFEWVWVSVPPASSLAAAVGSAFATTPRVSFQPDAVGTFVAQLSVSDGCSVTMDQAVVVVGHDTPFLTAPSTLAGRVHGAVSLADVHYVNSVGESVEDPVHTSTVPVSVTWSVVAAPEQSTPVVRTAGELRPAFTGDRAGAYTLELRVADGGTLSVATTVVHLSCVGVDTPDVPAVVRVALGDTAVVNAGSAGGGGVAWHLDDVDNTLVQRWVPASTPPSGVDSVLQAASRGALTPTGLTSSDLVVGPAGVAFTPDGLGTYVVRATPRAVGCGGDTSSAAAAHARTAVVVACGPAPTVSVPGAGGGVAVAVGVHVALRAVAGAGRPVAHAWTLDAAPGGSSLPPDPHRPVSATHNVSIAPDAPGVFLLTAWVSDGCSVATATVNVTAVATTRGGGGDNVVRPSPSAGATAAAGSSSYKGAFAAVLTVAVLQLAALVAGAVYVAKARRTITTVKEAKAMPSFFPDTDGAVPVGGVSTDDSTSGTHRSVDGNPGTAAVAPPPPPVPPVRVYSTRATRPTPPASPPAAAADTASPPPAAGVVAPVVRGDEFLGAAEATSDAVVASPTATIAGVTPLMATPPVRTSGAGSGVSGGRGVVPAAPRAVAPPPARSAIRMLSPEAVEKGAPVIVGPGVVVSPSKAAPPPPTAANSLSAPSPNSRRRLRPTNRRVVDTTPLPTPATTFDGDAAAAPMGVIISPSSAAAKPDSGAGGGGGIGGGIGAGTGAGAGMRRGGSSEALPTLQEVMTAQPPPPPSVRGRRSMSLRSSGSFGSRASADSNPGGGVDTPTAGATTGASKHGDAADDHEVVADGEDAVAALMASWRASASP